MRTCVHAYRMTVSPEAIWRNSFLVKKVVRMYARTQKTRTLINTSRYGRRRIDYGSTIRYHAVCKVQRA